tara:strand:+ start:6525 stop:6647 length:123 start_codon:yes stop_codon:yes gene_type:complete
MAHRQWSGWFLVLVFAALVLVFQHYQGSVLSPRRVRSIRM